MVLGITPNTKFVYSLKGFCNAESFLYIDLIYIYHIEVCQFYV